MEFVSRRIQRFCHGAERMPVDHGHVQLASTTSRDLVGRSANSEWQWRRPRTLLFADTSGQINVQSVFETYLPSVCGGLAGRDSEDASDVTPRTRRAGVATGLGATVGPRNGSELVKDAHDVGILSFVSRSWLVVPRCIRVEQQVTSRPTLRSPELTSRSARYSNASVKPLHVVRLKAGFLHLSSRPSNRISLVRGIQKPTFYVVVDNSVLVWFRLCSARTRLCSGK